jgi:hypothetical protein
VLHSPDKEFKFLACRQFFLTFVFLHSYRFFASEIIRATLFTSLGKELPYCCEVRIDRFKEPTENDKSPITRIEASIYVERDSQKGIVVGKGGSKVKEVGVEARRQLEDFLQGKVCACDEPKWITCTRNVLTPFSLALETKGTLATQCKG